MSRPNPSQMFQDSLVRRNLIDVYPRGKDPLKPGMSHGAIIRDPANAAVLLDEAGRSKLGEITKPTQRPVVYQRGLNWNMTAGVSPLALQGQRFEVDSFIVEVPSTAANSVFLGFGQAVTVTSGLEVRPGLPIFLGTDNTREQWELQRALEMLAAIMASQAEVSPLSAYRAPRVVFDLSGLYVVAAAPTAIAIMAFQVPEQQ